MSRYIDADELIVLGLDNPDDEHLFEFVPKEFIDNAPTADVVEVRHGEWRYGENDIGLDGYWCTACGKFVLWNYRGTIDFIHRYNYCPNCGAKMEGAEE